MAQSKNNKNEKGVAFEKRAKMDKAQQEILLICCIASAIIGFTLVGSIFLIRKISYNAKLIGANDIVIGTYKDMIPNANTTNFCISKQFFCACVVCHKRHSD